MFIILLSLTITSGYFFQEHHEACSELNKKEHKVKSCEMYE